MSQDAAEWAVVSGSQFRERRLRLNLTQEELANEAGIKSRDTVGAVETGAGGTVSRRRMEEALSRLEAEANMPRDPADQPAPASNLVEFEVIGDFGVRVVMKGPIENAAELEAMVVRLIRDMKGEG